MILHSSLFILSSHLQCLVLRGFHQFALAGPFVVDAAQVEYAVYDDAVQFVLVVLPELLGIGLDGVKADEEVSADAVALGVVEGDDVGVVVVLQVLAVHLQYALVVAEDVGHFAYALSVLGRYGLDPCVVLAFLDGGESYSVGLVSNHCCVEVLCVSSLLGSPKGGIGSMFNVQSSMFKVQAQTLRTLGTLKTLGALRTLGTPCSSMFRVQGW